MANIETSINYKSLRILFWNARSINKRKEELTNILKDTDIFLCVESWLNDSDKNKDYIYSPDFVQFKQNRSYAKAGRILILVRRNLAFHKINNITSPDISVELCGIRITNTNPTLDIITCYRSPGQTLSQAQWDTIVNNVNTNRHSILVGDFNAHNVIWNCKNTDSNGERLLNSTDDLDLFLHNYNTISRTDFKNNSHSNIDLLFSTTNIAQKIDIKVFDETLGSDHYPILCTIDIDKHIYIQKSFKLKSIRTNWELFAYNLEANYTNFLTTDYDNSSPQNKYEVFMNTITSAIKLSTPTKKKVLPQFHRNPVSWWDKDCDRVKRLRKAALKKWEYSNDLVDLIAYKKAVAIAIRTFKEKKKKTSKNTPLQLTFVQTPLTSGINAES